MMRNGLLVLLMLFAAGCVGHRLADPQVVIGHVDEMVQAGDTNGAIQELSLAVDKNYSESDRVLMFSRLLTMQLTAGLVDEARQEYFKAIDKHPFLVRPGLEVIADCLNRSGQFDILAGWAKSLQDSSLSPDASQFVFGVRLEALRGAGQFERVLEEAPVCVEKFGPDNGRRILRDALQSLMSNKQYTDAVRLIELIEKKFARVETLRQLTAVSRADVLALLGQWEDAEKQFVSASSLATDADIRDLIERLSHRGFENKKFSAVERICEYAMAKLMDKKSSQQTAAKYWFESALMQRDLSTAAFRLRSLAESSNISEPTVSMLFCGSFYEFMRNGTKENRLALMDLGETLASRYSEPKKKQEFINMVLDGSVISEDYKRTQRILRAGITERDRAWHEMALNKLQAHIALKEGRKQEAVERFRKFMEYISKSTWDENQYDPVSGRMVTKEMCLGLNAKRIGDILSSMGKRAEARQAYNEARSYYTNALLKLQPNSDEYRNVESRIAGIPVISDNR